jgi:peptidoglycan/LPS O-acetylase OafA/YrhL
MIALAVAWVAFYSYVIERGHDQAFYEAYAGRSGPIVSLVAGGPVFYLVALRLARRRGNGRAATIAALLYLLTDVAVFVAVGGVAFMVWLIFAGGATIKLGATVLGAARARR